MAQPLNGMTPDSPADATKPPMPSEWTRTYKSASGKAGRVFTSLYGTSEDITNDGYRRMLVNGCFWALGLEDAIKPDLNIAFVGPFKPNTFGGGAYARGIKPEMYAGFESPIPANNNTKNPNPKPAKKKDGKKDAAKKDDKPATAEAGRRRRSRAARHGQAGALRPHRTAGRQAHPHARGSGGDQRRQERRAGRQGHAVEHERRRASRHGRSTATRIPTAARAGRRTPRTPARRSPGGNSISGRRRTSRRSASGTARDSRADSMASRSRCSMRIGRRSSARRTSPRRKSMEIDVKNGGKLTYLAYDGKPGAPSASEDGEGGGKKPAARRQPPPSKEPALADVPADYRDPLPFAFQEGRRRRHPRQRPAGSHAARRLDGDAAAERSCRISRCASAT